VILALHKKLAVMLVLASSVAVLMRMPTVVRMGSTVFLASTRVT